VLARLSGARRVIGYSRDRRGWLLTDRLAPPRTEDGRFRPGPMLDYYNRLATKAGTADPGYQMQLPVSQPHEAQADAMLEQAGRRTDKPLVLLNPGGSFGPSKMWPARRYAQLADQLVCQHGAQILLNAAPAEKHIAARVAESMASRPLLSFARRDNSLPLLASLTRRCDLMVTNDTGARHFAAAAGIDLVTVFGSTDPRWTHLYYGRERIVRIEMRCSPCQQKLCPQPAGPLYHQCMERISPEMVMDACNELLASRAGRSGCCC
jgi:heptosyltransferase-2